MTNEQRTELSKELLSNMDLTKEQYIELCRMCDDLDLEPVGDEPKEIDPESLSWDEVIKNTENNQ